MPSSAPSRLGVIAVAALLVSSACTVADSEAGAGGDTLRIVLAQEPPTLEPCESSLTGTGMVVRSNITEPLIERDPTTASWIRCWPRPGDRPRRPHGRSTCAPA